MERLLEREAALAELGRRRQTAAQGRGQVVLLRGEAGVGKTAVIARFLAGLGPQTRVVRGWCDGLATPRPLGPLIDMLAGLSGAQVDRVQAGVAAGDLEAVYAGLPGLLGDVPASVWVIEDLHWADGATLDLLRFAARRIEALPVLVVVSYRDDEIGPGHPVAVLLGDLATSSGVSRIGLDRLSAAAVAALAAGSGVNADALYQLTGGNPFFVTEVLAAGPGALGAGSLPRSVSEAVAGRLARLSASGRESAYAAAVCGPRASPALVAAVCPGDAALAECLGAGVLVADGDVVGFRHELARRAADEQIPDYQRRVLHKRALTILAEPPVDPNTLAALVFHAEQAGDIDAVIGYGPTAAERAAALGANREAADLYALVLQHADAIPAGRKALWLEQHALRSYLCGLVDAAVASWQEAIGVRRDLGDRLAEGDDLRWLSHALWPLGRTTEARSAGRASLRLLEDLEPSPQLAWSLTNMARLAACSYDPACADYAARAITLGNRLDQPAVVIRAGYFAALPTVMRTDSGWDRLEAARRAALDVPEMTEHAGVMSVLNCLIATLHRDLDRAERYIAETKALCTDHELGMFAPLAVAAAGLVGLYRGDWVDAAACAEDVLSRPALSPLHRYTPLITVALIQARRGERSVAGLLDEALAVGEPRDLYRLGPVWAARAEAAWLADDDGACRAEAQAGLDVATAQADPWVVGHLQRWVYLSGGTPDTALVADDMTPYRLEISGDWQAAARSWADRGCPYDAALAELGGDIDAVQAALGTFRRLGARAAARRAQHRLARLRGRTGEIRRADTSADPHGLTKRERDVLELLAAGRSDAEIATALFISPKTANSHVCAIMTKLGVHNRTQAAAYVLQRRPGPPR